jgi:hypothetical protein
LQLSSVTSAQIISALGYTPFNPADINSTLQLSGGVLGVAPYTFAGTNAISSPYANVLNAQAIYAGPEYGVIANSSGAASANATKINNAIQDIYALGGGTIYLPCGPVFVGSALLNNVPGVLVSGCWPSSPTFHNAGTNGGVATEIVPTMSGPVLEHYTPPSSTTSTFNGGGFVNMMAIGNGVAGPLLYVNSITDGTYDLFLEDSVSVAAAEFTSGVSGTACGEACDDQREHINLKIRQLGTGTPQSIGGVLFTGSSNANFSFNTDVKLDIQNCNGIGVEFQSADNNYLPQVRVGKGGSSCSSGRAIQMDGPTSTFTVGGNSSNHFGNLSTTQSIYSQGTSDSGVTAGGSTLIDTLDVGNGTPTPTAGTGSIWVYRSDLTNIQSQVGGPGTYPNWTAWTPTLASSGGTQPTFSLISSFYNVINNEVRFHLDFEDVTDSGGTGCFTFTLPTTPSESDTAAGLVFGYHYAMSVQIAQYSTTATTCKYDGTYPGSNATYYIVNGSYLTE